MTEFERVLMNRDSMTEAEAKEEREHAREMFYEMIESGASYDGVEEMMLEEYGLEMDYLMDLI